MASETNGLANEANRLYWYSELSVADVAQQLDLSRRALYAAVRPLSAGEDCTECGGELTWANRSARDGGRANCAACADAHDEGTDRVRPVAARPRQAAARAREPLPADALKRRAVQLGGVALVGALVAAAVTAIATRD